MTPKKRPSVDPLARLSAQGFLGYVEEDTENSPYKVLDVAPNDIMDSFYQSREWRDPDRFRQLVHSIQSHGFNGVLIVCAHPHQDGKYQLIAGGHRRRDAAKEAGLATIPCLVIEYDRHRMALGTATENLIREDLSIPDEGKLYLKLRQDAGWTQGELAAQLEISRDRIKECEVAARDAEDIQAMLRASGDRGLRAAKSLRQLDKLDDPGQGIFRAATERAPLIQQFLAGELTTDGIQLAVDAIIARIGREAVQPAKETVSVVSPVEIRRQERVATLLKRFASWQKLVGDEPLYPEERAALTLLAQEIQECLSRSEKPVTE
jgi:ParB/RepB/Spo0J family partition protein